MITLQHDLGWRQTPLYPSALPRRSEPRVWVCKKVVEGSRWLAIRMGDHIAVVSHNAEPRGAP